MEKVNELYKKNDEAITNSAKEMVKAFKSKAEQASNPFTHEGATYKDNDTKGGHTWAYTDMEKEIVATVNVELGDIFYRLGEKLGRDNIGELLSDQQKQAIIDHIGDELTDILCEYVNETLGDTYGSDITTKVFECLTEGDCEPTKDYAFTPVDYPNPL